MIKTLELTAPLSLPSIGFATGYYTDTTTGIRYYYNAATNVWYKVVGSWLVPVEPSSIQGLAVAAQVTWLPSPSPKLSLAVGDTLRLNFSFKYIGDRVEDKEFFAEIGTKSLISSFNGITGGYARKIIDIPFCSTVQTLPYYIDIIIPEAAEGLTISTYVKWDQALYTEGESGTPCYLDIADVASTSGTGTFSEFKINSVQKAS